MSTSAIRLLLCAIGLTAFGPAPLARADNGLPRPCPPSLCPLGSYCLYYCIDGCWVYQASHPTSAAELEKLVGSGMMRLDCGDTCPGRERRYGGYYCICPPFQTPGTCSPTPVMAMPCQPCPPPVYCQPTCAPERRCRLFGRRHR